MHNISLAAVMSSHFPPVIRGAAEYISKYEYLNVGTFLEHLDSSDLQDLASRAARITVGVNTNEDLDCMVLLSGMLSQAEGNSLEELLASRVSNFMILITFEDLSRKGIIEFYREKATLGTELLDESIAKMK